jgi:hypothetical protein
MEPLPQTMPITPHDLPQPCRNRRARTFQAQRDSIFKCGRTSLILSGVCDACRGQLLCRPLRARRRAEMLGGKSKRRARRSPPAGSGQCCFLTTVAGRRGEGGLWRKGNFSGNSLRNLPMCANIVRRVYPNSCANSATSAPDFQRLLSWLTASNRLALRCCRRSSRASFSRSRRLA